MLWTSVSAAGAGVCGDFNRQSRNLDRPGVWSQIFNWWQNKKIPIWLDTESLFDAWALLRLLSLVSGHEPCDRGMRWYYSELGSHLFGRDGEWRPYRDRDPGESKLNSSHWELTEAQKLEAAVILVRVAWGGIRSGPTKETLPRSWLRVRPAQGRLVEPPISDLPAELLCPVLLPFVKL